MRTLLAFLFIVVTWPAQAERVARFDRQNTSYQTYLQDRFACQQASARTYYRGAIGSYSFGNGPQIMGRSVGGTVYSYSMYVSCMNARGYVARDNGRFGPPPGGVVPMGP